jgi:hypothetical protein
MKNNVATPGEVVRRIVFDYRMALILLGEALYIGGATPWVLVIAAMTVATQLLARTMAVSAALGAVVLAFFSMETLLIRVAPATAISLHVISNVLLLVGAAVVVGITEPARYSLRFGRIASEISTPLGVLYVLVGGLFLSVVVTGSRFMAWATNNDAVWTLVQARTLFADNGLVEGSLSNPAPLTAALISAGFAPGRNIAVESDLVAHDIALAGQLWLLVISVTALIVAHLVSESLASASTGIRWVGTLGSGLLLYTWYFAGYSTQFGFYNASIALVVMVCAWVAWNSRHLTARWQSLLLSAATLSMLATWAPLTLIPAGLVLAQLIQRRRELVARVREIVVAALGYAVVCGYVLLFSLPDLNSLGPALVADGGTVPLSLTHVAVVFVVTAMAIAALVKGGSQLGSPIVLGYLVISIATTVGLGYLVFQRLNEAIWWGYYPMKFAWLGTTVIVIIGMHALGVVVARLHTTSQRNLTFYGGVAALLGVVMLPGIPPMKVLFAPITNIVSDEFTNRNTIVDDISRLASYGEKNIAFGYSPNPRGDLDINHWLLQLNAMSADDDFEIRWFSYFADGSDPTITCDAIRTWGDGVIVHTSQSSNVAPLREACGDLNYRVVVHDGSESLN